MSVAEKLLQDRLSGESESAVKRVYHSKLEDSTVMLENPLKASKNAPKKPKKSKSTRQATQLSIKRSRMSYDAAKKLNRLWNDYISDLIGQDTQSIQQKMLKADLCGSELQVLQSNNPSLVNHTGICILETQQAFLIVTASSAYKSIPKNGSTFSIKLHADNFKFNNVDRLNKKFKHKLLL
ncbi:hypothetical protein E3P99_01138 [Wallemia hederae]|uniref:Uncharacterized protein n=1 Tax=Wallemia hederae TaxID=1540922 RepID=A0A4T0FRA9_9BASI|nr:hypothetical protein E3P99_01138 [Wallemia hederae]